MDNLPEDILDIIYKEKHKLEMVEIKKEIKEIYQYRIDKCYNDIENMLKESWYLYEPEYILSIYTALRNVGEIDDGELFHKIEEIENRVYMYMSDVVRFYDGDSMIIDKSYFYNNYDLSVYDYETV